MYLHTVLKYHKSQPQLIMMDTSDKSIVVRIMCDILPQTEFVRTLK